MKTLAIIVGVLLLGFTFVYNTFDWAPDRVADQKGQINNTLRDGVSDNYINEKAREDVKHLDGMVVEAIVQQQTLEGQYNDQVSDLNALKKSLSAEESMLKQGYNWLNTHSATDNLRIDGRVYTYSQVSRDVSTRVENCNKLRKDISDAQLLCDALSGKKAEIGQGIASAQSKIASLESEIDRVGSENKVLSLLGELESIKSPLKGFKGSEASKYIKEQKRRNSEMKARLAYFQNKAQQTGVIQWTQTAAAPTRQKADEYIRKHLTATTPASQGNGIFAPQAPVQQPAPIKTPVVPAAPTELQPMR